MRRSARWRNMLAILGAISLFCGALLGVRQVYIAFFSASEDLQATIERGAHYEPPDIQEYYELVKTTTSRETIDAAIKQASNEAGTEPPLKSMSDVLALTLQSKLKVYGSPIESYRGHWHAVVSNVGQLGVEDVVLQLPGTEVAVVRREKTDPVEVVSGSIITLGKMRAGQTVEVTAWTDGSPFRFDYDSVTLHHSRGEGSLSWDISFWEREPGLALIIFLLTAMVCSMSVVFALAMTSGIRAKKRTEGIRKSKSETKTETG